MLTIEKELIDNGWIVTHKIGNNELEGYKTPSLMSNLFNSYSKGNDKIVIGLNEKGLPPTLIYPRPRFKKTNGLLVELTDHDVNRWMEGKSIDEILNADSIIILS